MGAKIIEIIKTEFPFGKGVPGDPVRTVTQYWNLDGKLLFTKDTVNEDYVNANDLNSFLSGLRLKFTAKEGDETEVTRAKLEMIDKTIDYVLSHSIKV